MYELYNNDIQSDKGGNEEEGQVREFNPSVHTKLPSVYSLWISEEGSREWRRRSITIVVVIVQKLLVSWPDNNNGMIITRQSNGEELIRLLGSRCFCGYLGHQKK